MTTVATPPRSGNPAPGVIFECVTLGDPGSFLRAVLNDDLTVTVQDAHTTRTVSVGVFYSQGILQAWAARCHWGEEGWTLGPVGVRMARNFGRGELGLAPRA